MHFSTIITAAFGAASVLAAPTAPMLNRDIASTRDYETMSDYFNMLAKKVHNSKYMSSRPVCDIAQIIQPNSPSPLPVPSSGLTLKHVAIGRGVQNYTCATNTADDAPKAVGAVATLFDATCLVAAHPDVSSMLPRTSLEFNLTREDHLAAIPDTILAPSNLGVSGKHFFTDKGVPFFNLDTPAKNVGTAPCQKVDAQPAPEDAGRGQQGEKAVAWLKLNTTDLGATGEIREVYRLHTAGGSAPATCEGMAETFSVEYAAQYWFWQGPELTEVEEPAER